MNRVIVPRWVQLVMLPLAVVGLYVVLKAAGGVLLLFVIGAAVRSLLPWDSTSPEDDYPTRIQSAVFGYVRGQLLFSLVMGTSAGVLLWVLGSLGIFPDGRTYALFFGAFYAFAELIPYIGPAIGAFPPVMIALFSGT